MGLNRPKSHQKLFKSHFRGIGREDPYEQAMRAVKEREEMPDVKQMQYDMLQKQHTETSMKLKFKKGTDLIHGEEIEGVIYKYDLPMVNKPIQFRNSLMVIDEQEEMESTPVMNLFDELEIDKDASYEQFVIKTNQAFNNEIDMYGDIKKAGLADPKLLQFGIPIPYESLEDKQLMADLRLNMTHNYDLPSILDVHPNKFIATLRPVEEFRHTPVIPISEKDLSDYQKERDARNRQGYFVEIKKDTVYYYSIITFLF